MGAIHNLLQLDSKQVYFQIGTLMCWGREILIEFFVNKKKKKIEA
jgi:hypothetical protein